MSRYTCVHIHLVQASIRGDAMSAIYSSGGAKANVPGPKPPKLLDRMRHALRVKHYAYRTEQAYVQWVRR